MRVRVRVRVRVRACARVCVCNIYKTDIIVIFTTEGPVGKSSVNKEHNAFQIFEIRNRHVVVYNKHGI